MASGINRNFVERLFKTKKWYEHAITYISKNKKYIYFGVLILGVLTLLNPFYKNSVFAIIKAKSNKTKLQKELKAAQEHYKKDSIRLNLLETDPNALERIAREDYLMKAPGETIFIINDTTN